MFRYYSLLITSLLNLILFIIVEIFQRMILSSQKCQLWGCCKRNWSVCKNASCLHVFYTYPCEENLLSSHKLHLSAYLCIIIWSYTHIYLSYTDFLTYPLCLCSYQTNQLISSQMRHQVLLKCIEYAKKKKKNHT